jgi:hypothetical protein
VEGETLSHGDAEEIARKLTAHGLTAEPPRTEKLASAGVSFAMSARPARLGGQQSSGGETGAAR